MHKCKAERAYQQLREDTALAQSDSDVELLTFDLQQSLPTPVLTTNTVFYKRQLWTYNLHVGIHNCATGKGCMHMWHEGIASRGSQEVGSCMVNHLRHMTTTASHLILYSDACGGQDRNINLVCLWLHIVASPNYLLTKIDHKFMVTGHSFLPNDRDFGCIETARRKTQHLFVPEDWQRLVRTARQKNPFYVTDMKTEDFLSLKELTKAIVNRKNNTNQQKVEWLKIRWIQVNREKPYQFLYRYSHNTLET